MKEFKEKLIAFFYCFVFIFIRRDKKKDKDSEDEIIFVLREQAEDLMDQQSSYWDESLTQPQVQNNVRNYLQHCYNISEAEYDDPLL
jgi:cbb3-type cytochrome oxidase subunit 3